ncbi:DUF2267 domain-containing protein [Ectothiorhodospiraceae bacterium 2226]|nr:DUF2267 domain-containing protein [Ectothiorhodospiraceae bacterium 2226]
MRFEEFLDAVERRGRLASREEALRVTRATLETLAHRLGGGAVCGLAGQLPSEITQLLTHPSGEPGEAFGADEFLRRVCERAGADRAQTEQHAQTVLAVLRAAVGPAERSALLARLPTDYGRLFDDRWTRRPAP